MAAAITRSIVYSHARTWRRPWTMAWVRLLNMQRRRPWCRLLMDDVLIYIDDLMDLDVYGSVDDVMGSSMDDAMASSMRPSMVSLMASPMVHAMNHNIISAMGSSLDYAMASSIDAMYTTTDS